MTIKNLRILVQIEFASTTSRLWDGSGPYLDADGEIWAGVVLTEGLDRIESAINGEAAMLALALSGVDTRIADLANEEMDSGEVIGAVVTLMIQPCDEHDQPVGDPEVKFTGTIDNMPTDDTVQGENPHSTIVAEVVNRFTLRNRTSGSVLSDIDQRARSAVLNFLAAADRFCERVPGLAEKAIWWPRFT